MAEAETAEDVLTEQGEIGESPHVVTELARLRPKALVDPHGLARIFGCAEKTIRNWIQSGDLPAPFKLGQGRWWQAGRLCKHFEELARKAEAGEAEKGAKIVDINL
ncbi:MAG: hypothetical protein R6V05_00405 [Candidatus Brocadiia bacterium]